jgi:hypothetical protein
MLLELVAGNPLKSAYVGGCRRAVALRHLGRPDEAELAFAVAYGQATAANELVVAAYIRNDWASIQPPEVAAEWTQEALTLCEQAEAEGLGTPDNERCLPADRAYMEATLARIRRIDSPRAVMASAKRTLKAHAYGVHPRYKLAYLLVCVWELELYSPLAVSRKASVIAEAIRQHNYKMAGFAAARFWR